MLFLCYNSKQRCNSEEIKKSIECIIPHALGDHTECKISWCGYKLDLNNCKHKSLPHGKDLFGESLKNAPNNIFSDYCTETVVTKVAPCSNSQRNETLNSVVRSKNPKTRFYGGSDSNEILGRMCLLLKEIFDMLTLAEHWRQSILNLGHFAKITMRR